MSAPTDRTCLGFAFTGDQWVSVYWHEDGRVMAAFSLTPTLDVDAVTMGCAATEARARHAADAFLSYHRARYGWEHPAGHCSRLGQIVAESHDRQHLCERELPEEGPVAGVQAHLALTHRMAAPDAR